MTAEQELKKRFNTLVENLKKAYGLPYDEILALSAAEQPEQTIAVPLTALKDRRLGILEALVIHLKEEREMKFSEIARALDRDPRTIWVTYRNAKRKLNGGDTDA